MSYRGPENILHIENALFSRKELIDKYDSKLENKQNKLELKWVDHVLMKLRKGWIPDEQDVTLEVERTISHGLYLRRISLEKKNPLIKEVKLFMGQAEVISVDFSKK